LLLVCIQVETGRTLFSVQRAAFLMAMSEEVSTCFWRQALHQPTWQVNTYSVYTLLQHTCNQSSCGQDIDRSP
jgi:hypothetical protein